MRTTITIEDQLFRVIKIRAAELGTSFSHEISEALKRDLSRQSQDGQGVEPFVLITAGEGSEPVPGVDYSSNSALLDLMNEGLSVEKQR